jgi:hypothetical protein
MSHNSLYKNSWLQSNSIFKSRVAICINERTFEIKQDYQKIEPSTSPLHRESLIPLSNTNMQKILDIY